MQAYIRVFLLCAVSGIIALMVHKKKNHIHMFQMVKTFIFYVTVFYSILILVKKISHKTSVFLLYGFVSESWKIYLAYSAPLLVISIVMPLIVKKILLEKSDKFISLSVSMNISIVTIIYFFMGKINNRIFSVTIFLSVFLAFIIICFLTKDIKYCTPSFIKEHLILITSIILFWIILNVLYLPNELYLGNINDMEIPHGSFVKALLLGSIVYVIIYVVYILLLLLFLTEKQLILVCNFIFSFTFAEYIQSILLNGKLNILDGSLQKWPVATTAVNLLIWGLVIVGGALLPYIVKRNVDKIYFAVSVYISLILLVSWGYMSFTADLADEKEYYELTADGRVAVSSKHNVLVFVLDWFDWQIAEQIFEQDSDFMEPLKDFTWYRNTTSAYAFTDISIPYLLTNIEWKYNMEELEYRNYAYQNTTLLPDIANQKYDIGIYTYNYYLTEDVKDIIRNYSHGIVQDWNFMNVVEKMVQCSKYKCYPFILKNEYKYYVDGNFWYEMKNESQEIFNPGDDNQFYEELMSEGVHVGVDDEYEGAFRFYHLVGAHPPFEPDILTKGKNCMSIVYEYIDQLKEIGLYDEATIIITADHGQNYFDSGLSASLNLKPSSSPILFVKKSNQTNENEFDISLAPVSHREMAATIMSAITEDIIGYGNTFFDIVENSERKRYLTVKRHSLYEEYIIEGDVRNWNNWHLEQPINE